MKTTNSYLTDHLKDKAVIFNPSEGEIFAIGNSSVTLKVTGDITNGQLGVYEIALGPGTVGAQLHYHRYTSETFIVTKGTLTIQLADRITEAKEGAVVYIPAFTPHGFSNTSDDEVKVMLVFNPGQGREGFFKGMHEILSSATPDPDDFLKLYNKYDSFPADPSLLLPEVSQ